MRPPQLEKNPDKQQYPHQFKQHPRQLNVITWKDAPPKKEDRNVIKDEAALAKKEGDGTDTPVVRQVSRKEVSADAKCYMKIPQPPKSLVCDILQPSNGDSAIVEERQRPHVSLRRLTYRRRKLMERRGDQFVVILVTFVLTHNVVCECGLL